MDAAVRAALDGQDGMLRQPLREHLEDRLKVLAGQRRAAGHRLQRDGLAVGAIHPLEGHYWRSGSQSLLALQPVLESSCCPFWVEHSNITKSSQPRYLEN